MKWIVIALLMIGCAEITPDVKVWTEDADLDAESEMDSGVCIDGWLCYGPGGELHNKPCTDECMEIGNTSKFCFLNSCE